MLTSKTLGFKYIEQTQINIVNTWYKKLYSVYANCIFMFKLGQGIFEIRLANSEDLIVP